MTTVLIVDDHPLVADGVATMLKSETGISVVGSVKTGKEALIYIENQLPDIILLDINLPDSNGLELCKTFKILHENVKIIMLSSINDGIIISQALSNGADGYLLKDMERHELLKAIYTVLKGKIYVSASANEKLLEVYKQSSNQNSNSKIVLTRREKEILNLLDKGFNGPQIADKLYISSYTVETHRKNLMQKLETSTTQMLLKKAREMNFLTN